MTAWRSQSIIASAWKTNESHCTHHTNKKQWTHGGKSAHRRKNWLGDNPGQDMVTIEQWQSSMSKEHEGLKHTPLTGSVAIQTWTTITSPRQPNLDPDRLAPYTRSPMQKLASSPISHAHHTALPLQHETIQDTPKWEGKENKNIPRQTQQSQRDNKLMGDANTVTHCKCVKRPLVTQ